MTRFIIRTPRTSQPQSVTGLDLSNPLARKIKYASTLGNNVLDLKTGKLGVIGGGAPVKATTKGLARSFASASSQSITLPTNNMVSGYPLTVACWASTVPTAAGQVLYSFNGTNYHAILGYLNATLAVMPSVTQDPSFNRHVPVPAGLNYLVAIFRSTTWDLYVNGVLGVQSNLLSSSWAEPAAGNHSIGSRLGGASLRYHDGTISDLLVFQGELSDSEVKSLTNNPWQIYTPSTRVIWDGIAPAPSVATVNALVIGGGGGGGSGASGGGGAGGYQANASFTVTPQAYTITVGSGGAGSSDPTTALAGSDGASSVFSTITANGGGGGGSSSTNGRNGGSGGGGGYAGLGGTGNQGNNGGDGNASTSPYPSGGGGGSGSAGGNGTGSVSGNGGNGTANSISGSSVTYCGGGGGGATDQGATHGTGGTGGGGDGGIKTTHNTGYDGTANTGGGGGGATNTGGTNYTGGTGGSGIVIIAYPTDGSTGVSTSSTGGTITTSGGNTIHTFTTSGTWTMVSSVAVATNRQYSMVFG